jgi:putative ABC transport system substrate-binding protein
MILSICLLMLVGATTWLLPTAATAADIAILKSSDIAAYNQAVSGFKAAAGGGNTIVEYNLESSLEKGRELARQIHASGAALVLAVGLKAALAARLEIDDTPVIFTMVLDPPKHDLAAPNMTGVLIEVPLDRQFGGIRSVLPKVKRIGVLYDPSKSSQTIDDARRQAKAQGFDLVARQVTAEKEVPTSLRALLPTISALWLAPDSTVLSDESLRFILSTAFDQAVPVIGFSPEFVRSGALMSLSVDYGDVGRQAGTLARKILGGQLTLPLKSVPADRIKMAINLKTAKFLGIQVPKELENGADETY